MKKVVLSFALLVCALGLMGNFHRGSLGSDPYVASILAPGQIRAVGGGHLLWFRARGVVVAAGDHALMADFVGANPVPPVREGGEAGTGFARFQPVVYRGLYPGVDLVYEKSPSGVVKSTWRIAAGMVEGALESIAVRYNAPVEVEPSGRLALTFRSGKMRESRPVAWQERRGRRIPVEVAFRVRGENTVGFRAARLDPGLPLIIDPELEWNTFAGGEGYDYSVQNGVAADSAGNVYISGYSTSAWGNNPVRPYAGNGDGFVAKFDPAGNLVWNTFLGSSPCSEEAYGIAVDAAGNAVVTGMSSSDWGDNPVQAYAGGGDAFVAKLDPAGNLVWHTFLGGADYDVGMDVALDSAGNVYLTGSSASGWGTNTVEAFHENMDTFAAKLDSSGTVVWNTFLGGAGLDEGRGIEVSPDGRAFVAGESDSDWGSPKREHGGGVDAFVAALDPSGNRSWNTFLGGEGSEYAKGIALDASGGVYVAGTGFSAWPGVNPPVREYSGEDDAFAAKLDQEGNLVWHTFLGGYDRDFGAGVAVDSAGRVFLTGSGYNDWGSPIAAFTGPQDVFVAELDPAGAILWHTFLGGDSVNQSAGIGLAPLGNLYLSGWRASGWGNPVRPYTAEFDAYIVKLRRPRISGNTGVGGVTLTFVDGSEQRVTSDASGNYSLSVSDGWSGTVTPTRSGYAFDPAEREYSGILSDQTGQDYTAAMNPLTVTSPNGGERLAIGSSQRIRWTSSGLSGELRLELFRGATRVGLIADNLPVSSGGFDWVAGGTLGGTAPAGRDYRILAVTTDSLYSDFSDAGFTLNRAPYLRLLSPNGGESWASGGARLIRWCSRGISGQVRLVLFRNGIRVGVIAPRVPVTRGFYRWMVGAYRGGTAEAGAGYTVRVVSDHLLHGDDSDSDFTIR